MRVDEFQSRAYGLSLKAVAMGWILKSWLWVLS